MNGKPPIPLGYHTPDRRPQFEFSWGLPALLLFFLLCGLLGKGLQNSHQYTPLDPALEQALKDGTPLRVYYAPKH
jgi:hypothetical protein